MATSTIHWEPFSVKHTDYIKKAFESKMSCAEGSIRSGKTIDNCIVACIYLETCPDRIHLASGSTLANAKLNIGDCNGFGLEHLFRNRCRWGKYKNNDCLYINTQTGLKIVIFAGGGLANSYKKILGNSYGLWIATEINEHYDSDDSRESFISVAFGRQVASKKPMILWDLNPCAPNHRIYQKYIDKYKGTLVGGYNYQHFTLHDNLTITEQRLREIESQYTYGSVWYRRDILGERCSPEGLVFQLFADMPNEYMIDNLPKPGEIQQIRLGVDFGGSGSQHSFSATGIGPHMKNVYSLFTRRLNAVGMTATELATKFCDFAEMVFSHYDKGMVCFCDSAEQTLINQIRREVARRHLRVDVRNASKIAIVDRIRLINILLAQNRIKMVRGQTKSLQDAWMTAVWDMKEAEAGNDVRLDNGTSDIDSCDSFEYTIEGEMTNLVNCG